MLNSPYRVLIVDDCDITRRKIVDVINSSEQLQVVGEAENGIMALELLVQLKPDVVMLDVIMPRINGLTVLKRIMNTHPTPVVMFSCLTTVDAPISAEALRYGAVDCAVKPINLKCDSITLQASEIVDKIVAAASKGSHAKHRVIHSESTRNKILLVDDCLVTRKVVTRTLVAEGYKVFEAKNVAEAVATLTFRTLNLVLLDITLPDGNGYDILTKMRQKPATAHLPVVMLTSKDGLFDKLKGKMLNVDEYLTKPFRPDALLQLVNKHLK
jgi:DNA-binding response OmpR family regulator